MNQADKQEALRLVEAASRQTLGGLLAPTKLRFLIERQDDKDGERWRFCLEHGFPVKVMGTWLQYLPSASGPLHPYSKHGDTPNEAVDAAMAAMKGKA